MNQEKYIRVLEETINKLQEENHELKRKLKSGGRKEKLSARTKAYIRLDKEAGATIRDLAKKYECSIGLVHKTLNEGKGVSTMDKVLDFEILNKNDVIAHVIVDRENQIVDVKQYTDHPVHKQFKQKEITMQDIAKWLRGRCFPETRFNKDQLLQDLGLRTYSPLSIVKKTHGLQFEDYYWVRFQGERLCYDDIKIRD